MTAALVAEIRALRMAWRKSDDEYRAHPTAMCGGWDELPDGRVRPCPRTAHHRDALCQRCRADVASRKRAATP